MARPDLTRVPEWYHRYINLVQEDDLVTAIGSQTSSLAKFFMELPEEKRDYRYAEGKWSVKEMLQHIVDAERIFAYRALCFARKDKTPLPGFDENDYAYYSKGDNRDWNELLEEFTMLRRSNQLLFSSFDEEQLESPGTASGKPVYVLAIGFILVGHIEHHVNILKERYLNT